MIHGVEIKTLATNPDARGFFRELIRVTDDFEHSVVRLKEARNVKYADFVVPGQTLVVTAEVKKREGFVTSLVAQGSVHGNVAVSARLVLEIVPLEHLTPDLTALGPWSRDKLRKKLAELTVKLDSAVSVTA